MEAASGSAASLVESGSSSAGSSRMLTVEFAGLPEGTLGLMALQVKPGGKKLAVLLGLCGRDSRPKPKSLQATSSRTSSSAAAESDVVALKAPEIMATKVALPVWAAQAT